MKSHRLLATHIAICVSGKGEEEKEERNESVRDFWDPVGVPCEAAASPISLCSIAPRVKSSRNTAIRDKTYCRR